MALHLVKIRIQAGVNNDIIWLQSYIQKVLNNLSAHYKLKTRIENVLVKKYKVCDNVGNGNRAKVYTGKDEWLDRPVAIKVVADDECKYEFVDVLKEAAKINDIIPYSVPIPGAYIESDPYHVVMRYFKTGTLRKMIEGQEGTPWPF